MISKRLRFGVATPILTCSLLLLLGCGGSSSPELPRAAVKGEVTLDGQPLAEGVIRFIPQDGTTGPQTTVVVKDGRFDVTADYGPVVGQHRIEIESTDDGGFAMDDEQALENLKKNPKRIAVVKVPPQYNSRSKLKETVAAEGPNEFTFSLKSPRRRR